jgi:transglutaminase-like putative cysteine protease
VFVCFYVIFFNRLTRFCWGDLLRILKIIVPNVVPKTNYFSEKLFFTDTVVKKQFFPDWRSYLEEPRSLYISVPSVKFN